VGEKTKITVVADTYEIDGVYLTEQRSGVDRRQKKSKRVFYERRINSSPRRTTLKHIDEDV
jgi:predicted ribonuclease YlaK